MLWKTDESTSKDDMSRNKSEGPSNELLAKNGQVASSAAAKIALMGDPCLASPDATQTVSADASRDPSAVSAAEASVVAEWKVGDVILDLYEVRQIHEGGGMGLVYRAYHRGWNTELAVKSPRTAYFQTEAQKENFSRECETWIKLGLHPHMVSCYYVRKLGGIPRVFAEYVEGGSLKEWIDSRKLYEGGPHEALKRILDIAIQMAWGLQHAHTQEVIHQDVKPANVILTPEGIAKVTDFGLARARAITDEATATGKLRSILVSHGGMTPAYCSPEQARKEPVTRKTDIWSWAVSLLEMFVGEVCWQSGVAAPDALERLEELRLAEAGPPPMPTALRDFLRECFAQNPGNRPRDMREVGRRIKEIFFHATREAYGRTEEKAAKLSADSLNNQAVSLLDLGRQEEAERLLGEAMQAAPNHLDATYNLGLLRWRIGQMDDQELLERLRQADVPAETTWKKVLLEARVLLEADDCEGALAALKALEEAEALRPEVVALATLTRTRLPTSRRCVRTFEGGISTSLSAAGYLALSARSLGPELWDVVTGRCLRVFEGHEGAAATCVCLSSDGRWALSGAWGYRSTDKTMRLWDVSSGRCVRTFEGHSCGVTSVSLTADAKWALSRDADGILRLWEVSSGRCVRAFGNGQKYRSERQAFLSADGRWALTGGDEGSGQRMMRLWDVETGRCVKALEGHSGAVRFVAMTPDSRWALSIGDDRTMKLWELSSGRCMLTFVGHKYPLTWACLTSDCRWALSAGEGGPGEEATLKLWDVSSCRCLRTFRLGESLGEIQTQRKPRPLPTAVCFSAEGRWALSSRNGDRSLQLWEVFGNATPLTAPFELCRPVSSNLALSAEIRVAELMQHGQQALGSGDAAAAARDLRLARGLSGHSRHSKLLSAWMQLYGRLPRTSLTGIWLHTTIEGHRDFSLSADARKAVSLNANGGLILWEVPSGRCLRSLAPDPYVSEVESVCLSADGRLVISKGLERGSLQDISTGRCLRHFAWSKCEWDAPVSVISLSCDNQWLLLGRGHLGAERVAGQPYEVELWDLAGGRWIRTFYHDDDVTSILFSADDRFALSGSYDGTLRLWELATGRCLRIFEGHEDHVNSVCLNADSRLALSGGDDGTLKLWEVASGRCARTFEGHKGAVNSVSLSADGRFAVSGSSDRTVKLWEVSTGRCIRTLEAHRDAVNAVSQSADGRWVLSASSDGTLKLWALDWELEERVAADWDEAALVHLVNFLTLHTPYAAQLPPGSKPSEELLALALTRMGQPNWSEEDFKQLLDTLSFAGYGFLRPDGVLRELEKMAAAWQGPPPLPVAEERG